MQADEQTKLYKQDTTARYSVSSHFYFKLRQVRANKKVQIRYYSPIFCWLADACLLSITKRSNNLPSWGPVIIALPTFPERKLQNNKLLLVFLKSLYCDINCCFSSPYSCVKMRVFLPLLFSIATNMKLRDGNAVSNDIIGKSKETPKVKGVQEFHEDTHGRNRLRARSTRITRSTTPQNGSALAESFVLRCVGAWWFSCRGRCSREWDQGPTVTRLQCFCDAYCETFTDCCADYDQFCSPSNLLAPQDVILKSSYFTPTKTVPQIQRSTKPLQANGCDLFTTKNLTSQLLTSTLQPFKSLIVLPSSADKKITTRATILSGFLREERREVPDERWKCVQDGHANELASGYD